MDENIKNSFQKVKKDIFQIRQEISLLRQGLIETRNLLNAFYEILKKINKESYSSAQAKQSNNSKPLSTDRQQTDNTSTYNSSLSTRFKPLNDQISKISTRNIGVSTDRQQTDNRQTTDTSTHNFQAKTPKIEKLDNFKQDLESFELKAKDIKFKFKSLTDQEFKVFLVLRQIEEEKGYADYSSIAKKLNLTESSIRDYVQRVIKKGIPVEKIKINNRLIQLKVSTKLKKLLSIPTLINLREISEREFNQTKLNDY